MALYPYSSGVRGRMLPLSRCPHSCGREDTGAGAAPAPRPPPAPCWPGRWRGPSSGAGPGCRGRHHLPAEAVWAGGCAGYSSAGPRHLAVIGAAAAASSPPLYSLSNSAWCVSCLQMLECYKLRWPHRRWCGGLLRVWPSPWWSPATRWGRGSRRYQTHPDPLLMKVCTANQGQCNVQRWYKVISNTSAAGWSYSSSRFSGSATRISRLGTGPSLDTIVPHWCISSSLSAY